MLPADQSFNHFHAVAGEVQLRLVVEYKLAQVDGRAEVVRERQLASGVLVRVAVYISNPPPTALA